MRVIAGEYRSRRLESLPGMDVRPTPDKMRETLFDVLGPSIAGLSFVDAYAGTGAVGIEALSRGARQVVFLEKSRDACEVLRKNLAVLRIGREGRLIQGDAARQLPRVAADVVFLDPPYTKEREYEAAMGALAVQPPPLVIAQHSSRFALKDQYGPLRRTRLLKQGENALSFYRPIGLAEEAHRDRPAALSSEPEVAAGPEEPNRTVPES